MTSVFGGTGITRSQAARMAYPATTLRSGLRIGLPMQAVATTTNAVSANVMYAWPIPLPASGSISGVAIQVGTPVAGVSGKLGLAEPGPDGFPLRLLAESPNVVDMNLAAATELVAAFSSNLAFNPQFLWGLSVFNGAAQPVTVGSFAGPSAFPGHYIGASSIGGYTAQGGVGPSIRLFRAHTYTDAFPSTLTGWSVAQANPSSPWMVAVTA